MTSDPRRNRLSHSNIGGIMANRLRLLVASALGLFSLGANAYVFPPPPPGFGGSPGSWTVNPTTGDRVIDGVIRQSKVLNVPGGGSVGVAYRLKQSASRVAAGAVFLNPYVRGGLAIAAWLGVAGLIWDAANQKWVKNNPDALPPFDGNEYSLDPNFGNGPTTAIGYSKAEVCALYLPIYKSLGYKITGVKSAGSNCVFTGDASVNNNQPFDVPTGNIVSRASAKCPLGWYVTPAGCVQTPPPKVLTQQEFEDALAPKPMPEGVPGELPKPTPLPIEAPVVNPDETGSPVPRPWVQPTGDPVPNPTYDPNAAPSPTNQPYSQPGVRNKPSPTVNEPFRIDQQPINRPKPTDKPNPEPESEPGVEDGDKPKPENEQSLCEKHPDIIACQKLEMPEDPGKLPVKEVDFDMTPESGFAGAAACPAPVQAQLNGKTYGFSWQPFCNSLDMIKPLLLAMAWLSAAFILLGARGN